MTSTCSLIWTIALELDRYAKRILAILKVSPSNIGDEIQYVAKSFTVGTNDVSQHLESLKTLLQANEILVRFKASVAQNEISKEGDVELAQKLKFVGAFLVELDGSVYMTEHRITGRFKKFNSNVAFGYRNSEFYDCFSHYSLYFSNGENLLCDLQGIAILQGSMMLLTDPEIHSVDGSSDQDSAAAIGLETFKSTHVCGNLCRNLGIENNELKLKESDSE